jgi:hypothetical protein
MVCLGSLGPITLGDCRGSTNLNVKTTTNISSAVNDSLKSISSQQSNTAVIQNQDVFLENKTATCCSPFKVQQNFKVTIVDQTKMTDSFVSQQVSKISNELVNSLDQASKMTTGVLAGANGPKLKASIESALSQSSVKNKMADTFRNAVKNTLAKQSQKVYINCAIDSPPPPPSSSGMPDTGCYVDQNFAFDMTTRNIMKGVFSALSENVGVAKVLNDIKQTNVSENRGLDTITGQIADVAKSFISGYTLIIIAVIAAIVLALPLLIKAFKSGAFKSIASKSVPAVAPAVAPAVEAAVAQFLRSRR